MDGCHVNYHYGVQLPAARERVFFFFFNSPHDPVMVSIFNLRRAVACGLDATPIRRLWTFEHLILPLGGAVDATGPDCLFAVAQIYFDAGLVEGRICSATVQTPRSRSHD